MWGTFTFSLVTVGAPLFAFLPLCTAFSSHSLLPYFDFGRSWPILEWAEIVHWHWMAVGGEAVGGFGLFLVLAPFLFFLAFFVYFWPPFLSIVALPCL